LGSKKTVPADRYVGTAVRFRRKELGLSQTDLAKALGVTFKQVQKYEYGTNRIPVGRLFRIAETLQVPVSYFFRDMNASDTQRVELRTVDLLRLPGAVVLLEHYSKIEDPAHRKHFLKLAQSLAE